MHCSHLTIKENVAFGLKLRKENKIPSKKVKDILAITGLEGWVTAIPNNFQAGRDNVAGARLGH
jgi:putative spermidine/putrescine transport system ATP-binding protein